jgi:hypothetical protein
LRIQPVAKQRTFQTLPFEQYLHLVNPLLACDHADTAYPWQTRELLQDGIHVTARFETSMAIDHLLRMHLPTLVVVVSTQLKCRLTSRKIFRHCKIIFSVRLFVLPYAAIRKRWTSHSLRTRQPLRNELRPNSQMHKFMTRFQIPP